MPVDDPSDGEDNPSDAGVDTAGGKGDLPEHGDEEPTPSLDAILELLSQYQRREIIRFLHQADDDEYGIDRVLDHLAHVEERRTGEVPGEDHLLSVLVHVHGPKLEEAGVLDYDGKHRRIRYYPDDRIELALERIEELEAEL